MKENPVTMKTTLSGHQKGSVSPLTNLANVRIPDNLAHTSMPVQSAIKEAITEVSATKTSPLQPEPQESKIKNNKISKHQSSSRVENDVLVDKGNFSEAFAKISPKTISSIHYSSSVNQPSTSSTASCSGAFAHNKHSLPLPCPVSTEKLSKLLADYDVSKSQKLLKGFTEGFVIPSTIMEDPLKLNYVNHRSANLNESIIQSKLNAELEKGRISGPYKKPPLENMIFSPLGLVPKKTPNEFRLIHDLSFPKGESVNSHIDKASSTVEYETLDTCIGIINSIGKGCLISKADLKDAFRIIPIAPISYRMLGFKWQGNYYFDRCLPMGCSISCHVFESLSQALQWILTQKLGVQFASHILDDFIFFGHPGSSACREGLHQFLALAEHINLPVKHSKTVYPTTTAVLHGIEIDTVKMEMRLPDDKVEAARLAVNEMYKRKKVQLRTLQSLIGVLNFACRVIVPGRAFLRRLIDLTMGISHKDHWIRLNQEARKDLTAWKFFLDHYNGKNLCLPSNWISSNKINLHSDASGFGFAAVYGHRWFQGKFPDEWKQTNIAIKELLPIVLALKLWGKLMANTRMLFLTDNESVMFVINSQSSKDPMLMELVRSLVISSMSHNIHFRAKHIPGKYNVIPDLLSRLQEEKARKIAPWLKGEPDVIPQDWLPG